jgi:hypothetical protein
MIARGPDRRSGRATFCGGMADRRRSNFERRGTVPGRSRSTVEQQLYGERRQYRKGQ